jgi:hypothetical protein
MEAYRDQYATLFNNGRKVVVVGISVDPDTALASWARGLGLPRGVRQRLAAVRSAPPTARTTKLERSTTARCT